MILYSKFSNERDNRFAVCTQIAEEDGIRSVSKFAVTEEGHEHIAHMYQSFQSLSKQLAQSRFTPNVCTMDGTTAKFEYLVGENLSDILIQLKETDEAGFLSAMKEFLTELDAMADTSFTAGPKFREIFGAAVPEEGLPAASVCDIDTLPDNIIVSNREWNVIDYEWTFDFPIPIKYLKWRVLMYFGLRTDSECLLRRLGLYDTAEISGKDEETFRSMESAFQAYVEGNKVPLRVQYRSITPGFDVLDHGTGTVIAEEVDYVKIVFGGNEGKQVRHRLKDDEFSYETLLNGAKTVTVYPTRGAQMLTDIAIRVDDEPVYMMQMKHNGLALNETSLLFNDERPYVSFEVPKDGWKLTMRFCTEALTLPGSNLMIREMPKKTVRAEVYCDHGQGFRTDEMQLVRVNENGDASVSFAIGDISSIRIDPSDYPCHVTIQSLATDLGAIDMDQVKVNGFRYHKNRLIFTEEDPKLEIDASLWKKGSRVFSMRFHVEDLTLQAAKLMIEEITPLERELYFLRRRDEHRLAMIDDRDRLLNYLSQTKVMRGYRKYLQSRKRPDPFLSLRHQLENNLLIPEIDRYGIYACHDGIIYRKDYCLMRGWAFDRENPITAIRVKNVNHEEIPSEMMWKIRDDVNAAYQLDPKAHVGFHVSVNYSDIHDEPLYYEIESRAGYVCVPIDFESDPSKRESTELVQEHNYNEWYQRWAPTEETLEAQRREVFENGPKFSIVIPLYKTNELYLRELIDSVREQTYTNWELLLSDGSGPNSPLAPVLDKLEALDSRIHAIRNQKQLRISQNTNAALEQVSGEYVVFCDHDDLLTPDALYENAKMIKAHPDVEMIYSDEDKISDDGVVEYPHFKPDFSYDLLLSNNYICHLCVVKKELVDRVGMLNPEFDGSQDYDFVLRCAEQIEDLTGTGRVTKIRHIPKVLYHWRIAENSTASDPDTKGYATVSGRLALQAHLDRMQIPATAKDGSIPGYYEVEYHWQEKPLVSVIIPNKDHIDDLDKCLTSILGRSSYSNYEIIVVENNSEEDETFTYYGKVTEEHPEVKVVTFKGAFNYSAINNFGVEQSKGEYLLFLNNDTSFIYKNGIESMLGICMRGDVGAVGARLYYDDDTIQHAGVVMGLCGLAAHAFARVEKGDPGYMGRIISTQDLSAVTAACMMVKRSVYDKVDGFFEGLAVAFNDVDFCMKITKAGYRIVYNPGTELYHYESKSRGYEDTPEKRARFEHEVETFNERWPEILKNGDPFYNPNLSLRLSGYRLKDDDE